MNTENMSLREIVVQWKPHAEQLGKAVKAFQGERGEDKIYWETFLKLNPSLANDLGIDPDGHWDKKLANALSFFYAYHVTGTRKERDSKRRAKEREQGRSTPEQRAAWREQKRESNARLAEGIRRKRVHSRVKPIGP